MTAIAPNVAERIRPRWWNVRAFHSGFSLTGLGQYIGSIGMPRALLTCLVLQCIALAFCPPTKVRQRVEVGRACP
jgi:hypothetical protein